MHVDFWGGGPLSYALPVGILVAGIFALSALFQRRFISAPMGIAIVLAGAAVASGSVSATHDRQAFEDAVQRTYGLSLSDAQVKTLLVDHSYRRYAPDITVRSEQGTATPFGTIDIAHDGKQEAITLYKVNGLWYLGTPVNTALHELPSTISQVN